MGGLCQNFLESNWFPKRLEMFHKDRVRNYGEERCMGLVKRQNPQVRMNTPEC